MFVSFEGIDGSGKSTQARLLAEALGPEAVLVREPGGTPAGERVRDLLKDPEVEIGPMAELLLFCAARAQLVGEAIRPALEAGRNVVCDRFADSSIAYQGGGRGLGVAEVEELCRAATGGLVPDVTILLRIDPGPAAERLRATRDPRADRFEAEGIGLQRAVAEAYEEIAARHPGRVRVVDAAEDVERVRAAVAAALEDAVERPA